MALTLNFNQRRYHNLNLLKFTGAHRFSRPVFMASEIRRELWWDPPRLRSPTTDRRRGSTYVTNEFAEPACLQDPNPEADLSCTDDLHTP